MQVYERVLEKRLRVRVEIDSMQFGFVPGKGTTDPIFYFATASREILGEGEIVVFWVCRSREGI